MACRRWDTAGDIEQPRYEDPVDSKDARTYFAWGLLGGFGIWVMLLFVGLLFVDGRVLLRLLGILGAVALLLPFTLHLVSQLRRRVRLTESVLLSGMFLYAPALATLPFVILGAQGLTDGGRVFASQTYHFAFSFAGFTFIAMVVAWSKGSGTPGHEPLAKPGWPPES